MKKLRSLLMPIIALSLFESCNNVSYTVTEQEMYDAFAFKGVEYLQIKLAETDLHTDQLFTPSSYHWIHENYELDYYTEYFVIKNGEKYRKYARNDKNKNFVEEEYNEGDFRTISEAAETILGYLKDFKYKDFKYQSNSKEYLIDHTSVGKLEHSAIRFVNKKVVYLDSWFDDEARASGSRYTVSYKKIEPPTPPSI